MSLANSSKKQVYYKAYSAGAITPGAPRDITVDPANTGGQILRYITCNASLNKSTYQGAEKRVDMQIYDFRHGGRVVPATIVGQLSGKTYQDFFEATARGTWAAATSKDNTVFTNIAFTSGVGTVGASTWAAQGFRVGDVVQFTGLSAAANNGVNVQIVSLSGTAATFSPASLLADMGADTSFSVATIGRKLLLPASSPVSRLFMLEEYYSDVDLSMLTKEIRWGSIRVTMPAEGIVGIQIDGMGRDVERKTTGNSPFFGSPTAVTTGNLQTSNGGQLIIGGTAQAIVTGMDFTMTSKPSSAPVAFSVYRPEIWLGTMNVSGTINAMFQDNTIPAYFDNETEIEIALMVTDSSATNAQFHSFFFPRVKLGSMQFGDQTDAGIPLTASFQALLKSTTTGYDSTSIVIQDSLSA